MASVPAQDDEVLKKINERLADWQAVVKHWSRLEQHRGLGEHDALGHHLHARHLDDDADRKRRRVLLCAIDGCRPDALAAADAPTIHALADAGFCCWAARTCMPSITMPCFNSMLRGVDTTTHGILENCQREPEVGIPSLLDAAHAADLRTAFIYNWGALRFLHDSFSVDVTASIPDACPAGVDEWVASTTVALLDEADPDVLFVYLGHTDEVGHAEGWMSPEYMAAIAGADRCLKRVLDAFAERGWLENTTICVTADHGGGGDNGEFDHGSDDPLDTTIPWILSGAGVRKGAKADISMPQIRVFDTCTTLAYCAGIAHDERWEGRVVAEALEDSMTPSERAQLAAQ